MRIVNAARGELIDEDALLAALEDGRVAAAGLDVHAQEPPADWRLAQHPRVVATPHVGAQTAEAQERVGTDIAIQVRDFLKGGIIQHAVNFFSLSGDVYDQVKPAMDLAERLGTFLAQACPGTPERIEVGLYGDLREIDAKPILAAAVCGVMRCAFPENVTLVNARALASERGIDVAGVHLVGQGRLLEPDGHPPQDLASATSRWRGRCSGATTSASSTWTAWRWTRSPRDTCCWSGTTTRRAWSATSGRLLGQRHINIARMTVGRKPGSGRAVMLIEVDNEVPAGRAGRGDDRPRRARGAGAEAGLIPCPSASTWVAPNCSWSRRGPRAVSSARTHRRSPSMAGAQRGDLRLPRRAR